MKKLMILALAAFAVTVTNADDKDYLSFTAQGGEVSVSMVRAYFEWGDPPSLNFETSSNKEDWTDFAPGKTKVLLQAGETVYFRQANDADIESLGGKWKFSFSSLSEGVTVSAGGNVMSLLSKDLTATAVGESAFFGLFHDCALLTTAPKLPAMSLAAKSYQSMFLDCTSLIVPPKLPALILTEHCYDYMFAGCRSLTTAPEISAAVLATSCCYGMFVSCVSLKVAPNLPVKTLADECYRYMFAGCTSLTVPPELPATTLKPGCYEEMFRGCDALETAPELRATELADECYCQMFYECTALTTAPSLPAKTLKKSCYDTMFYGCTALTATPELSATTLAYFCYRSMFEGCSALRQAVVTGIVTLGDPFSCYDVFRNCYSSGRLISSLSAMPNNYYWSFPSGWGAKNLEDLVSVTVPKVPHLTVKVSNQYGPVSGEVGSGAVKFNLLNGDDITINLVVDDGWVLKNENQYSLNSISDSIVFGSTQDYPIPVVISEDEEKYAAMQEKLRAAEFAAVVVTAVTVDGQVMSYADYKAKCWEYGVTPQPEQQIVACDEIAVKKESIQAAKAEAVQIVNGQIELGVSVLSNADITASSANWAPVKFTKDTQIGLSADGTKLILPIPVAAQQGFMVLQSGGAKAVPSDGGTSGFYMIKVVQ